MGDDAGGAKASSRDHPEPLIATKDEPLKAERAGKADYLWYGPPSPAKVGLSSLSRGNGDTTGRVREARCKGEAHAKTASLT